MNIIYTFLTVSVLGAVIDFVWIGVLMNGFYKKELGALARLSDTGNWNVHIPSTAIVYLALMALLTIFVLPKVVGLPLWQAFLWGALFGFLTYCFYDFTNMAILQGWTWKMLIVDIIWGGVLGGILTVLLSVFSKLYQ
jgi:uncharacterized membrane protein